MEVMKPSSLKAFSISVAVFLAMTDSLEGPPVTTAILALFLGSLLTAMLLSRSSNQLCSSAHGLAIAHQ